MADKPKREPKLKCPLSEEQKEIVKELADVVEKHRKLGKKFTG
jgi:hypothetical protein